MINVGKLVPLEKNPREISKASLERLADEKQQTISKIERLKPHRWKKGQSGNPTGRPKLVKTIPDLLRWSGALDAPEALVAKMRGVFNIPPEEKLTVDQATILRSRMEALNGDARHLDFWASRTEGKVTDRLEVSGEAALRVVEEIVDGDAKGAKDAGSN